MKYEVHVQQIVPCVRSYEVEALSLPEAKALAEWKFDNEEEDLSRNFQWDAAEDARAVVVYEAGTHNKLWPLDEASAEFILRQLIENENDPMSAKFLPRYRGLIQNARDLVASKPELPR
jgi:hypothetical protein